jgi:hypothetical protein
MDLSTENLVAALAVISGEQSEDMAEIVAIVRKAEPNFAATLFSAWRAEGIELSPALREEVDEISGRIEFYRSVAARLLAEVDSLTTISRGLRRSPRSKRRCCSVITPMSESRPASRSARIWPSSPP